MTAAISLTGAGNRGYPTQPSVPRTQASTQRRARERSVFFFSSRRLHTRLVSDWSSDVCSSDLAFHREQQVNAVQRIHLQLFKRAVDGHRLGRQVLRLGDNAGDARDQFIGHKICVTVSK